MACCNLCKKSGVVLIGSTERKKNVSYRLRSVLNYCSDCDSKRSDFFASDVSGDYDEQDFINNEKGDFNVK